LCKNQNLIDEKRGGGLNVSNYKQENLHSE
jgi:hypothetical protein